MKTIVVLGVMFVSGALAMAAINRRGELPYAAAAAASAIELPVRTAVPVPALPGPPALPPGADGLAPLAFRATIVWQGVQGEQRVVQDITRTVERVRLVPEGSRSEWLFERNPVDTRRAAGYLVDHDAREILAHQESDLRNRLGLNGWADVLMMRFHPDSLAALRATDERESAAGATFVKYVTGDGGRPGAAEVWWSDTLLVPLRQTVREPGRVVTTTLSRLSPEVNLAELADPRVRFPEYAVRDIADQADEHSH